MRLHRRYRFERTRGFFRLGQSHDTLPNWYTLNFNLMQHHKWSLSDLENMLPFERELYVTLLLQWLEEERRRQREERMRNG